jgi:hypothetical protein
MSAAASLTSEAADDMLTSRAPYAQRTAPRGSGADDDDGEGRAPRGPPDTVAVAGVMVFAGTGTQCTAEPSGSAYSVPLRRTECSATPPAVDSACRDECGSATGSSAPSDGNAVRPEDRRAAMRGWDASIRV